MIEILAALPEDVLAMAELFQEMDRFYGEREIESIDHKAAQINAVLFDVSPLAFSLLAWDDQQLIGFAGYSFLWPAAGTTKSLYLKELYVKESHRGKCAGKRLMHELFKVAVESNCSRVEWTSDADNVDSQDFYEKLQLSVLPSKVFYRAEGEALQGFIDGR
jgi:GNAT superfamily N-acetyltransferase